MAQTTGIMRGDCAIYNNTAKVAHSVSATLDISMNTRDATTKDTTAWEDVLEGLLSWTASGEFYFAEDATEGYEDLYDDMILRNTVTVLYSNANSGDVEYSGSAYITSLSRNGATDNDNESFSVTFQGTGTLSKASI